jgi:hypothetical protein
MSLNRFVDIQRAAAAGWELMMESDWRTHNLWRPVRLGAVAASREGGA